MLSYWADTAQRRAGYLPLAADVECAVAVIGAGYTGLVAATYLLDEGVDTVILEARQVGWGASGRNGGSATPRYKKGFAALARDFGDDAARLLHRELHGGLDAIERNVDRYRIDCDFRRCGQVTAAHSAAALKDAEDDVAWLRAVAQDDVPQVLDRSEVTARLGVATYAGGYFDRRGAGIHPLNYANGLAAGLVARGLRIFEGTDATGIHESAEGVRIATATGATVRARSLILASDAYTGAGVMPAGLRHRFLTVSSSLMVTAPLPPALAATIVPGRHIVADTFSLLHYFHMLPDGRLMFGGRGAVTARENQARIFDALERRMRKIFPTLAGIQVTHRWSGLVGLSQDGYPHTVRLGKAIHCGFGYGGRGVVLSHVLGRVLAGMACGRTERLAALTEVAPKPIPLYAVKRPLMGVAARFLGLRDRWQAAR